MKDKAIIFAMFVGWIAANEQVVAEVFVPNGDDQVIATWSVSDTSALSDDERLDLALEHLSNTTQPLQVIDHAEEAKDQLEKIAVSESNRTDVLYAQARLQQHKHQFDEALISLQKLIESNPRHGGSWLMKSSIHAIKGEFEAANEACKKTFGLLDTAIGLTCTLDVSGLKGDLEKSYATLSTMANSVNFDKDTREWLVQVLASQALQLGKDEEANSWLLELDLETSSLSAIALWSDVQLAAGRYEVVRNTLESLVDSRLSHQQSIRFVDDAILLRLAIASKNDQNALWTNLLDKRISLRLKLGDLTHMAELARYYIDVRPDREHALYWAQLNWEQSKLYEDKNILVAAQNMKEGKS